MTSPSGYARRKSWLAKAASSEGSAKVPVMGCIERLAAAAAVLATTAASRRGSCLLRVTSKDEGKERCHPAVEALAALRVL